MAPRYLGVSSNNDKDDSFELLERSKTGQRSASESLDNDFPASTARLPARTLPIRSTKDVVSSAFWTGLIATTIVVGLGVLVSKLDLFLEYADTYVDLLSNSVSCDLQVQNGGSLQNAFTINMRSATHLTFTEAKAIDVIWQLFVGAGGRFVMAWIAYKVFMDGLTRQLELSSMSYQLYASITFSTTSLFSVWYAVKAVYYTKGWRSKFFLAWFVLSTIYLLGFPTLMSATAPSSAGFKIDNDTFITPDSSNLTTCYDVSDGALIDLQNGTIADGPPVSEYNFYDPSNYEEPSPAMLHDVQQNLPLFYGLYNCKVLDHVFESCSYG